MAKFTSGKYAKAMCDRCGDEVKYKALRLEWTGLKVCRTCLDPKTALEFPSNFPTDPEALKDPRVDNDVEAGDGTIGIDKTIPSSFKGYGIEIELGDITVSVS
jgi:hypothetical protein